MIIGLPGDILKAAKYRRQEESKCDTLVNRVATDKALVGCLLCLVPYFIVKFSFGFFFPLCKPTQVNKFSTQIFCYRNEKFLKHSWGSFKVF